MSETLRVARLHRDAPPARQRFFQQNRQRLLQPTARQMIEADLDHEAGGDHVAIDFGQRELEVDGWEAHDSAAEQVRLLVGGLVGQKFLEIVEGHILILGGYAIHVALLRYWTE